jgi:hypothetical protein
MADLVKRGTFGSSFEKWLFHHLSRCELQMVGDTITTSKRAAMGLALFNASALYWTLDKSGDKYLEAGTAPAQAGGTCVSAKFIVPSYDEAGWKKLVRCEYFSEIYSLMRIDVRRRHAVPDKIFPFYLA